MIKFHIRVPYKIGSTKEVVDILNRMNEHEDNQSVACVEDDHVAVQIDDNSKDELILDVRLLGIEWKTDDSCNHGFCII